MADEKNLETSTVKRFINRLSPAQRIFLVTVIVLTIIGIILIINAAVVFNYGILFNNLSPRDSGLILSHLKSMNIPYKIESDGSAIKVPKNKIAELRIELAANGLPEEGGVGLGFFNKNAFPAPGFLNNMNYIHSLENELARNISQLNEVIAAKVHITIPKFSSFTDVKDLPKASIILKMRPGSQFSNHIIPAILHLTAQSVEGLKPENITVLDVTGNLLSNPIENQDEMFTDTRLTYQKNLENSFARKIINLLEPIVGPGKVRANVKLNLDFDKVETTEEVVDPERVAKISEKSGISSSGGIGTTDSTAGINNQTGLSGPNARLKSENSEVNYEVSKKVTHVIKPAGEIKKISAAVVLDDNVRVAMIGDQLQKDILKRTPEELETYTRLIQLAIGYNAERGDIIEVANLSFDTSALTESDFLQEQEKNKELIYDLFKYGFYIIIILLLFLLIRPVFRKAVEIVKSAGSPGYEGMGMHGLDRAKIAAIQDAMDKAEIERELLEQYKIPKSSKKSSIIRDKVIDFAGKNIDETTSLVRSLLVED